MRISPGRNAVTLYKQYIPIKPMYMISLWQCVEIPILLSCEESHSLQIRWIFFSEVNYLSAGV